MIVVVEFWLKTFIYDSIRTTHETVSYSLTFDGLMMLQCIETIIGEYAQFCLVCALLCMCVFVCPC